jgi:hypothetical protein
VVNNYFLKFSDNKEYLYKDENFETISMLNNNYLYVLIIKLKLTTC